MRLSHRGGKARALNCETLEDRTTPALAYALSGANLLAFDTATPSVTTTTAITGVNASETLVGIDFRPQNGLLYSLGVNATANTGTLYAISIRTGVAAPVGATSSVALTTDGTTAVDLPDPATVGYGFDFNPAADRVRVVAGSLNFRINPNTGAPVDGDNTGLTTGVVMGTNPDGPINGGTTTVDAAAYTNNQPNNGNVTTLYTLDAASNMLFIQGQAVAPISPNSGTQTGGQIVTLGGATLDFTNVNGFDIPSGVNAPGSNAAVTTGSGFAVLTVGSTTLLYSINLVNGQAALAGTIAGPLTGLAVQSDLGGFPAVALDATGLGTANLVRFSTSTPGTTTTVAIAGIDASETLVGLDFRPQTGQLYALGVNGTTGNGTLYLIDPQTGAASIVGGVAGSVDISVALPAPSATVGYGIDFNPTVDLLRVVTNTGLNFRVTPGTGVPVGGAGAAPDSNLAGSTVSATAYTNSFGQTTGVGGPTTQYTLDAATDTLFIQNPPNSGTQTQGKPVTLNGAPLDFSAVNGFDIPGARVATSNTVASGFGYASLVVNIGGTPTTVLYRINLSTGAATNLGAVTGNPSLDGLTLADAPAGTVSFQSATISVTESGTNAAVVLTRTGGSNGPLTVTVNVTGGSATAGTDFTAGPFTVTIPDGATSAILNIPLANDALAEGNETIALSLSGPTAGALGAQATTTVTINDNDQNVAALFASGDAVTVMGSDGAIRFTFFPYGPGFVGGIRVARGDVNGDGFDDIITVPATGAPQVRVFDGLTGGLLADFVAWPVAIFGPASLASGDVDNDGFDDIILGTATKFGAFGVFDGQTFTLMAAVAPFGLIPLGVNVASGDINNDGFDDVVLGVSSAIGGVVALSGQDFSVLRFFVPTGALPIGVNVAVGDLNNDGFDDIAVGTSGLIPAAAVFNGQNLAPLVVLAPYGPGNFGLNVGLSDLNNDGRAEFILAPTSGPSPVLIFNGLDFSLFAALPGGAGGVFVG